MTFASAARVLRPLGKRVGYGPFAVPLPGLRHATLGSVSPLVSIIILVSVGLSQGAGINSCVIRVIVSMYNTFDSD